MTGALLHASSNHGEGSSETIIKMNIHYCVTILLIIISKGDTIYIYIVARGSNIEVKNKRRKVKNRRIVRKKGLIKKIKRK